LALGGVSLFSGVALLGAVGALTGHETVFRVLTGGGGVVGAVTLFVALALERRERRTKARSPRP
jgi:hypothetical protein